MDQALADLLEAAGYVWNARYRLWEHPATRRALDGDVAARLTADQLVFWIEDGDPEAARRG